MQHEKELRKLFDESTVKILTDTRVITFDSFKKAIDQKMAEAYEYGRKEAHNALKQ